MDHPISDQPAQTPTSLLVLSRAAQNKIRPPELSSVLSALGNQHRRVLFEMLCHNEAQIEDLIEITGSPYQSIRKQLQVLEEAKLITSFKDKNCRFFHATPFALAMLQVWTETMSRIIDKI